ncbi:Metallo-peptidase family M12-domain-containing protein, partial [Cunninghamella echinulata]
MFLTAHSLNNRRLLRIEALNKVNVDIAPRPDTFFQKRDISANKHYKPRVQSIEHDDILRFTLNAYNQTHHIHLVPNHDLFHPNAVVNTEGVDKPLNHKEYRVYRGYVVDSTLSEKRWQEDQVGLWRDHETLNNHGDGGILGWARFIIRHDIKHDLEYPIFEGAFMTNDDTYHVKSSETYQRVKRSDDAELHHAYRSPSSNVHMVIYRDSDTVVVPVMKRDGTIAYGDSCAVDKLLYNNNQKSYSFDPALSLISSSPIKEKEKELDTHLSKLNYDAFNGIHNMAMMGSLSKRAPTGCPTTKKINYMGAAADCTYTKYYQSDTQARMQIINDWNTASAVYEKQMNIGLGLINITVMSSTCPTTPDPNNVWNQGCSNAYDITTRLSDFSRWRAKTPNDGAGLWHLMTNCPTGAELGVAWVGALCTTDVQQQRDGGQTQYVSGTGVSSVVRDEWKVVAHEIGHGFGAKHDCTADTCRCNGSTCDCCPLS